MRTYLIFVGLALVGCAPTTQYIRADGQYVSEQQAELDRAACDAESNHRLCMVGKGYFLVPKDQAAAKSAQLAAIADEDRKQAELAAQAEAKKKARKRKHAAVPQSAAKGAATATTVDEDRKQLERAVQAEAARQAGEKKK